jgi:predicted ATPase/class 3 adenylate cyclase
MKRLQDKLNESLPNGTVTFLFTDIEASTALARSFPDQMPVLLERHYAILEKSIQEHHGYIFLIVGDAFCVAFHTVTDALFAAIKAQRALQNEAWDPAPILVRMGIHTGEATISEHDGRSGGYSGYLTLACVQRVMSSAHGGQILLSNASAELVRGALQGGISLLDLGKYRLKGVTNPENLWQIVVDNLLTEFPPLLTPPVITNNLPVQTTAFIGREIELEEIIKRLNTDSVRLLTLTGPGGIGKTRIALQAANKLIERFGDGVYFVDLAPIRNPDSVPIVIAQTLGLRETSNRPLLDDLIDHLKNKNLLLLLDNFEQVTSAAPKVVELLQNCPQLKMIVTTREPLRIRSENIFPIPPLAIPQINRKQSSIEKLTQYDAVRLFIERAQAVNPNFEVTNENAPAVAEICSRLDGLPLAIELATARTSIFSPQALLERLGNRLKLLRGGARDLPARQQTLHAAIDWSYELLDMNEQRLFQLLSVFQGCSIEAIETIAAQMEASFGDNANSLDMVSSLLDKSLVRQISLESGESRLVMLETIREFAAEKINEDQGFCAEAQQSHANYYVSFTQKQLERLTGSRREVVLGDLYSDIENVRLAWTYWVAKRDLEKLGILIDGLWLIYDSRGWYQSTIELTRDMLNVLSCFPSTPERIQQEILLQTSLARALQVIKGYTQEVEQAYTRALSLSHQVGDVPELFPVLRGLGSLYGYLAEYEKAGQMALRILSIAERLQDLNMLVEGHLRFGYLQAFTGNITLGLAHLEKAIAIYDPDRFGSPRFQLGNNPGVIGLNVSALLLWMVGFPDQALERAYKAIALAKRLDHSYSLAYAQFHVGILHLWRREMGLALECSQAVLDIAAEHEFLVWQAVATCLEGAALAAMGQPEQGLSLVRQGIDSYQVLNTPPVFWPMLIFMEAGVCGLAGKPEQGLAALDRALDIFDPNNKDAFLIEFFCLKGDLLLAQTADHSSDAEFLYLRGLEIAIEKGTSMLELRAAVRLYRLWQNQGKSEQGRRLLSEAYAKFTEGFTTLDLQEARVLIEKM